MLAGRLGRGHQVSAPVICWAVQRKYNLGQLCVQARHPFCAMCSSEKWGHPAQVLPMLQGRWGLPIQYLGQQMELTFME